jgi:hypothetical protein
MLGDAVVVLNGAVEAGDGQFLFRLGRIDGVNPGAIVSLHRLSAPEAIIAFAKAVSASVNSAWLEPVAYEARGVKKAVADGTALLARCRTDCFLEGRVEAAEPDFVLRLRPPDGSTPFERKVESLLRALVSEQDTATWVRLALVDNVDIADLNFVVDRERVWLIPGALKLTTRYRVPSLEIASLTAESLRTALRAIARHRNLLRVASQTQLAVGPNGVRTKRALKVALDARIYSLDDYGANGCKPLKGCEGWDQREPVPLFASDPIVSLAPGNCLVTKVQNVSSDTPFAHTPLFAYSNFAIGTFPGLNPREHGHLNPSETIFVPLCLPKATPGSAGASRFADLDSLVLLLIGHPPEPLPTFAWYTQDGLNDNKASSRAKPRGNAADLESMLEDAFAARRASRGARRDSDDSGAITISVRPAS